MFIRPTVQRFLAKALPTDGITATILRLDNSAVTLRDPVSFDVIQVLARPSELQQVNLLCAIGDRVMLTWNASCEWIDVLQWVPDPTTAEEPLLPRSSPL